MNQSNFYKYLLIVSFISILSGCGAIQKARFYKPESGNTEIANLSWGDGLAVLNDGMCVWVGDSSALYLPLLAGPIGLPIFPLGILTKTPDRPGYFDLSIWLVPESSAKGLTFDPTKVSVNFNNDQIVKPSTIQVSRFKTVLEKERTYMFTPDTVERINYPEHWGAKPYLDFSKPVDLWDWSRFILRFEKPNQESSPSQVNIGGIASNDFEHKIISFKFEEVSEIRYVISGRTANNERGGDSPGVPCRKIMSGREVVSNQSIHTTQKDVLAK